MKKLNILGLVLFSVCVTALADDEDEGPVTPPSKCEGKILRLLWKSVVNMPGEYGRFSGLIFLVLIFVLLC